MGPSSNIAPHCMGPSSKNIAPHCKNVCSCVKVDVWMTQLLMGSYGEGWSLVKTAGLSGLDGLAESGIKFVGRWYPNRTLSLVTKKNLRGYFWSKCSDSENGRRCYFRKSYCWLGTPRKRRKCPLWRRHLPKSCYIPWVRPSVWKKCVASAAWNGLIYLHIPQWWKLSVHQGGYWTQSGLIR